MQKLQAERDRCLATNRHSKPLANLPYFGGGGSCPKMFRQIGVHLSTLESPGMMTTTLFHRTVCQFAIVVLALACPPAGAATSDSPADQQTTTESIDIHGIRILDVEGNIHALGEVDGLEGIAFVFISSECPISRRYVPELNRLAQSDAADRIRFYGVLSDLSVSRQAAENFVSEFQVAFPVLLDTSRDLAALFTPTHVPQAFVVRASGQLVYRGRIDDQYANVDKRRPQAREKDLLAAMTAIANGDEVLVSRTAPVGCRFETMPIASDVTYARHIAPILLANCAECHRDGEVAPFSLLTYEDAAKRSQWIAEVTESRLMPPWKAATGHGDFLGERRLTERQIELISAWDAAGAARGDEADLPPQPEFPSGWRMGEPDVVLQAPAAYPVPADGPDVFQHFYVPIDIPEEKVVVGFEFRPGNPAVAHHSILMLDSRGLSRKLDAETPEPGWTSSGSVDAVGGILGIWTPGMTPRRFSAGAGIPISPGTDLVVQLHLHPSGKPETEQSQIALYFADEDEPIETAISPVPMLMGSVIIDVPPGESRHRVASSVTLPAPITLLSVFPHMHLIAKEMKVTATKPSGETESLIWIPDWNFYWQDSYVYREPVDLPAGTRIDVEAYYDNSADNPFNPHSPPEPVRFGNGSNDEMCFAIFQTLENDERALRKIGRATMTTAMKAFNEAELTPEARVYIMNEMMKLFRGGGR